MSQCPYCFKNDYWNRFLPSNFFRQCENFKEYSIRNTKTLKVGVYFSILSYVLLFLIGILIY